MNSSVEQLNQLSHFRHKQLLLLNKQVIHKMTEELILETT